MCGIVADLGPKQAQSKVRALMSRTKNKNSDDAESYFRDDYVEEFVGLFLFLETLKKSIEQNLEMVKFKTWYKDTKKFKGQIVLPFSKKYSNLFLPLRYKKEVNKTDELVRKINIRIDDLYKVQTVKNVDIVLSLIRQVNVILKSISNKK